MALTCRCAEVPFNLSHHQWVSNVAGGVGGLSAAAALLKSMDKVIIFEKDDLMGDVKLESVDEVSW